MSARDLDRRPPLRRLLAGMRPHAGWAAAGLAAGLLFVLQTIASRWIVGVVIDSAAVRHDRGRVVIALVIAVTLPVVAAVATVTEVRCTARFAQGYLRDLRVRLLDHLYGLDLDFFTHERSGRLVTRLTSDVDNVQQAVQSSGTLLVRAVATILLTLGALWLASPLLALTAVAVLPPLAVATVVFNRRQFRAQSATRDRVADTMVAANEAFTGIRVVQAFGIEAARDELFDLANRSLVRARRRTSLNGGLFLPVVELLSAAALAAVLAVGAWLLLTHRGVTAGVLAAPFLVAGLFEPIQQLTELANTLQNAGASFSKVHAFLAERPLVSDSADATPLPAGPGAVTVEHVTFRYDTAGPDVLHGVDVRVRPGERIGLVGESGSGKTTLAKLVARFHDPRCGRVLVDGSDIRSVTTTSLRRAVALVPQEGFLFNGTVADNIAAAKPGAGRAEVDAACDALGVRDILERLPEGLDTDVGSAGALLSSGQRQLVALARAFVADPRVLVLDEVTSNVDPATQEALERAFESLLHGRTAIVIAHRVSTAMRSDRVVLLDAGTVVDCGPPAELVAAGGPFAAWVTGDPTRVRG